MGDVLIVFSSSTTANRLKKLAFKNQIKGVSIVQTPKAISKDGCTYSLRCSAGQVSELTALADEYGIRYNKIYREYLGMDGLKSYEPY